MANIDTINGKDTSDIDQLNRINIEDIDKVNGQDISTTPPDSVSVSPTTLDFYDAPATDSTTVTSSGTWTAAVISDTFSLIDSFTASGYSGNSLSVTIQEPSTYPAVATIRVTRGLATADLSVTYEPL